MLAVVYICIRRHHAIGVYSRRFRQIAQLLGLFNKLCGRRPCLEHCHLISLSILPINSLSLDDAQLFVDFKSENFGIVWFWTRSRNIFLIHLQKYMGKWCSKKCPVNIYQVHISRVISLLTIWTVNSDPSTSQFICDSHWEHLESIAEHSWTLSETPLIIFLLHNLQPPWSRDISCMNQAVQLPSLSVKIL